jgi:hypothetical protein
VLDFNEKHRRSGIVTNQPGAGPYDHGRPHASTIVCDRPECRKRAIQWVAAATNETAVYVPDRP